MELRELAEKLGGRTVEGDAHRQVDGVATLEDGGPGQLGFLRGAGFLAALETSAIGCVVAPEGLDVGDRPVLRSPNPSLDFARATGLLHPRERPPAGVHPTAFVADDAEVDPSAAVGPLSSVGARSRIGPRTVVHANVAIAADVTIGSDCVLHSGVVVREETRLGDRVQLQPGCAIGGDGFGYEFDEQGRHEKVPQIGRVELGDDVEIGANACVDRARLGVTRIGDGVKIDDLVMVGHNVEIGAHSVLISQVGVAGSARVGERVFLMAQSGVGGHVTVGDGTFVGARGGVIEDTPAGSRVWGFPAMPERAWHRSQAVFGRLSELVRRVRRLEKRAGVDGEGA